MASADLRKELKCSICLNLYTEPVSLRCGHNFCRDCIVMALDSQEKSGEYFCPECREKYTERPPLERNMKLMSDLMDNFLSSWKADLEVVCTFCVSPVPATKSCLHCEASFCNKHLNNHSKGEQHVLTEPTATFEDKKCSTHQEILKYYCTEDNACICMSCWVAGDHKGHHLELLNEASEKKFREVTGRLKSKLEETESKIQNLETDRIKHKEIADIYTRRTANYIRLAITKVEEMERRFQSIMSSREEKLSQSVLNLTHQLEKQKDDLSRMINDIEDLHRTTDPSTFLKKGLMTEDMISKSGGMIGDVGDARYLDEVELKKTLIDTLRKTFIRLRRLYK